MGTTFSLDKGLSIPSVFQQKYIPSLNGLRAVAILLVVAEHLKYGDYCPGIFFVLSRYLALGSFGVQIFFVLSGFLITGLLLKEKVETSRIALKKFYLRRMLRIVPAFYFYLGFIILFKCLYIVYAGNEAILASGLFVINFIKAPNSWLTGHSWSLAVEQQFYLVLPLLIVFLPRKYPFVIIAVTLYYIFYYYLRYYHFLFIFRGFLFTAPALMAGALLSVALFKGWLKNMHGILMHPVFAFSLLFAAMSFLPRSFNFAPLFFYPFDYLVSSLLIAVFIYYIVHCDAKNIVYKVLNFPVISYLGVLSYSLYLWQEPFLARAENYQVKPFWTAYPLNLLFVVTAALLSYYLVERPFLRLKIYLR